jgi:hypothetical protein
MHWNADLEALSHKDTSRNGVLEPFFPAIDITRSGVSCYPTAFLSNKLVQRPLKFQQVTANNSLDFVQFLGGGRKKERKKRKKKRTHARTLNLGHYAFQNLFF